ncbi:MAG: CvpA family protein [Candidatus Competibacterales bacterium]
MDIFAELTWTDYIVLGIILISAIIGLWRGFVREVLALFTWVAAFTVAIAFAEPVAAQLAAYVAVPSVRTILACGGLFLVTLFIGGVVVLVMTRLVKFTGIGGTDRLIGLVFGVLRGGAVVVALVMLAGLTPLPTDPWWQQSKTLPFFEGLADWVSQYLPEDLAEQFRFESDPAPPASTTG